MARGRSGIGVTVAGGVILFVTLVVSCFGMAMLGRAVAGPPLSEQNGAVADIPPDYLAAYRSAAQRFRLSDEGWSYLAGIGKVESDHGRSTAPGVRSGQNAHGCCAGPMQIDNGAGTGGGTWGAFKVDGDGDGRFDIYDPDDAAATAARYLEASGAPRDWRAALYAYNHAGWYVDKVTAQAAAYRREAAASSGAQLPEMPGQAWLAPVPGFPGERCDARVVAEVAALTNAYGLRLTDCFGGAPHAVGGEHPLGLAADLVPVDGDWRRTERLARAGGWNPACAASGCAGRGPFRVVLYNGFPGHGDPRFSSQPHLHLSWDHSPARPYTRAAWVRLVLDPSSPEAP
jgi:hypothetical protein